MTKFVSNNELEICGMSEPFRSSYESSNKGNETQIAFTFELREIGLVMRPLLKLIKTALHDGAAQTVENVQNTA